MRKKEGFGSGLGPWSASGKKWETMTPKKKLQVLLGPDKFKMWYATAIFEPKSIHFETRFQADYAHSHHEPEIMQAFGFLPTLGVKERLPVIEQAAAEVVPIEKARTPKIGYSAREMVLLNLPHSDPKAPVWVRKNGIVSLVIQGGYRVRDTTDAPEYLGIPYGATARLILFYLMTEATLNKSPRVYLGRSFNAFLETIGATKNSRGKKTGAASALRQLDRLLNASFQIQQKTENHEAEIFRTKFLPLAEGYEIWFSKKEKDRSQAKLFDSFVELSTTLYDSLQRSPIPLDWNILLKLRKSPLAIDLYSLLTYESAKVQKKGKARFIPWASLKEQMGAEYSRLDNFVTAAKKELKKIAAIYPELSLGDRKAGIEIKADSLPSVPSLPELPSS